MPLIDQKCKESIPPISVSAEGVCKLLSQIKTHKSPGPDGIPNMILKECAIELAPAIAALYQVSLNTGELPSDWRNANIACIFKKGDKHAAENYRPISLTSVTCKLLEHIICRHMLNHFDKHQILTTLNHGFRSGSIHAKPNS